MTKLIKEGVHVSLEACPAKLTGYMSNTKRERDEFLPYPWKKYGFVKEKEVDNLTQRIYNNKSIEDIVCKEKPAKPFRPEVMEKVTPKGETWKRIDRPLSHLAITSEGIIWNTHTRRPVKPTMSRHAVSYNVTGIPVKWELLFKEAGWEWNVDKVESKYNQYNYPMNDYRIADRSKARKPKQRKTKIPHIGLYKDITE